MSRVTPSGTDLPTWMASWLRDQSLSESLTSEQCKFKKRLQRSSENQQPKASKMKQESNRENREAPRKEVAKIREIENERRLIVYLGLGRQRG